MKHFLSALALICIGATAQAQVGHLPQNSPYRDLENSQELTFFGGHYRAAKDPIGIAPRDGGMWGVRYQIHVGGPAYMMARWSHVYSERVAIDPSTVVACRQLGHHILSLHLYALDLLPY